MSDSDSDTNNNTTATGKGKQLQQHKQALKNLKQKCQQEVKKTKDKSMKREIEQKYADMETSLIKEFEEKLKIENQEAGGGPSESDVKETNTVTKSSNDKDKVLTQLSDSVSPAKDINNEKGTLDNDGDDNEEVDKNPNEEDQEDDPEALEAARIARKKAKAARKKEQQETKKREKEETKDSERAVLQANSLGKREMDSIWSQLKVQKPFPLKIVDVPTDGNCLFRAIERQLKHPINQVNEPEKSFTHEQLRMLCCLFLKQNVDDYIAFLIDEQTGEMMDMDQHVKQLENGAWGGDMEISALSKALGMRIRVFQGSTSVSGGEAPANLVFGEEFWNNNEIELKIAYHKHLYSSAHYNSVEV